MVALQYEYNEKEEHRRQQMTYHHDELELNVNAIFSIDDSELFPEDEIEGVFDGYCVGLEYKWIIYAIAKAVEEQYRGAVHWRKQQQCLMCMVKTDRDKIKFGVKVYESRRWRTAWNDPQFERGQKPYRAVHVIRFWRIEGDSYEFLKMKNLRLLICADVMSGWNKSQRRRLRKLYKAVVDRESNGDPDGLNKGIHIARFSEEVQQREQLDRYLF